MAHKVDYAQKVPPWLNLNGAFIAEMDRCAAFFTQMGIC